MHVAMALTGILNVNKPAGLSSRAIVDCVERLTHPIKSGHAGTLDPLATGVLVICVGQATRLIQFVQRMPKTYHATFLLGHSSETDDIEGDVVPVFDAPEPTRESLESVLTQFIGDIQQRPPAHSAIKLAGRRAYDLARRGVTVELAARIVTVRSIVVRRYEYPDLKLDIECGSGTYVRSLGRDIGAALGTAAVMTALARTAIGKFRVQDAIPLDELTADSLRQHLQPARAAVGALPCVALSEAQLLEIRHGRPILSSWLAAGLPPLNGSELAAVDAAGQLAAILYEKQPGELWPNMNFA